MKGEFMIGDAVRSSNPNNRTHGMVGEVKETYYGGRCGVVFPPSTRIIVMREASLELHKKQHSKPLQLYFITSRSNLSVRGVWSLDSVIPIAALNMEDLLKQLVDAENDIEIAPDDVLIRVATGEMYTITNQLVATKIGG